MEEQRDGSRGSDALFPESIPVWDVVSDRNDSGGVLQSVCTGMAGKKSVIKN